MQMVTGTTLPNTVITCVLQLEKHDNHVITSATMRHTQLLLFGMVCDRGRTYHGDAAQHYEQTDAVEDAHISVDSVVSREQSLPKKST